MSFTKKSWLIAAALYALFVYWYTDFGGPLSDDEIAEYMVKMEARLSDSDPRAMQRIENFMREDSGRQFFMVNLIDMNEDPGDVPGAEPGESAAELMNRYMAYMYPALFGRACHPSVLGDAVSGAVDMVGVDEALRHWDQGALFRYRSRRTFMEIVANAEQGDSHKFKLAALDKTIAFPIETQINFGDPRLLLGLLLVAVTSLLNNLRGRPKP